ncbi:MAG: hypothetical protein ABI946_11420 [Chthoniobacterales bacterium]
MMRVLWLFILALPCAVAAEPKKRPPTYFDSPCKCRGDHGEDRWKAKTDKAGVPRGALAIRVSTPSELYEWVGLAGLKDDSPRKAPEESRWVRVSGRVVEVKAEADGDVHFALEDASGNKRGRILAEVPYGEHWCALRQAVFAWTKKGILFPKPFQDSSANLISARKPVVTVTGKVFFDAHHAGKNPLANRSNNDHSGELAAWEIHPVARIDEIVEVRRAELVRPPQPTRPRTRPKTRRPVHYRMNYLSHAATRKPA